MTLRITIDIFSGRSNPVIELDEAESREMTDLIQSVDLSAAAEPPAPSTAPAPLGYRGLLIEHIGTDTDAGLPRRLNVAGHPRDFDQRVETVRSEVEEFVFGPTRSIAEEKLSEDVATFCQQAREEAISAGARASVVSPNVFPFINWACQCAPIYEPGWWNDGGQRQLLNNCYNYSTNYRTDTFAQPGRGAGALMTSVSCAGVKPLALLDGLEGAFGVGYQCPGVGHLVALVIAPGFDFHWYRKGWGGLWSHKIGPLPATDTDNDGNLIYDPRFAARGPYTDFCGFLIVHHGHIKLA